MNTNLILLSDFSDVCFRSAFQQYFAELDIHVSDWDGLFDEMNREGNNLAYLLPADGGGAAAFLQFQLTGFSNWFLEEDLGFIREFWVDPARRSRGIGTMLLVAAEQYFVQRGVFHALLTADNAVGFYLARGYRKSPGIRAKNQMEVLSKYLA